MFDESTKPPGVLGILRFFYPARLAQARRAVDAFLAQSYSRKHLIVLNRSPGPVDVLTRHDPRVVEVLGPAPLADILPGFAGCWCLRWFDTDISWEHRIAWQMAHRSGDLPVALDSVVAVDLPNGRAAAVRPARGVPGTEIFPIEYSGGLAAQLHALDFDAEFAADAWASDILGDSARIGLPPAAKAQAEALVIRVTEADAPPEARATADAWLSGCPHNFFNLGREARPYVIAALRDAMGIETRLTEEIQ